MSNGTDQFDLNQDGVVSGTEMEKSEKIIALENQDKKENAQRKMAWVALGGMVLYPFITIIMAYMGLDASILASMADLYFISAAGIVAAFYGKEAYMSKHRKGFDNY